MFIVYQYIMDSSFKLPIEYLEKKHLINDNVKKDLELVCFEDPDKQVYKKMFGLNNYNILNESKWNTYFTSDIDYLKDTQKLLCEEELPKPVDCEKSINIYKETKTSKEGFIHKYDYIEYDMLKPLNENSNFLQFFSLYNISSPIISFITPVLFLIMPFFIMKLQGHIITVKNYFDVLIKIVKNHSIGKLFTMESEMPFTKKLYILFSFGFYIFQIYQNVLYSKRFLKNMLHIHEELFTIRDFIKNTIENMDKMCELELKTYLPFFENIKLQRDKLEVIINEIINISIPELSINKISELGNIMKLFYKMYMNDSYKDTIEYAIYFNGYLENMNTIKDKITNNVMNKCNFNKNVSFKNAYFVEYENKENVKNTYNINKNMLITGPNASGKTTMLKTTMLNIILSQQIGCGYYSSADMNPYQHIHSYINIPDTSGRDSLFQSEARRCKDILETIDSFHNDRHFCIFDELFSGTNPTEATASSYGFLSYIKKYKNVNCMITTHFIKLCKLLKKDIESIYMDAILENGTIQYLYKMKRGVSSVNGGIQVLKDIGFPEDMLQYTLKIKK